MGAASAGIAAKDFLSAAVGDAVSGAGCWERPGLALSAASPAIAAIKVEVGACVLKFEVRFEVKFEEPRSDELRFEETEFDAPKFEVARFEVSDATLS